MKGNELIGIVTSRDLRFENRFDAPVTEVMTPQDRLVTVGEDASNDEVQALLHKHRIEKILVVNSGFELRGLITVKDIQKSDEYPHACKDPYQRLRVGAAVGAGLGTHDRVEALIERHRGGVGFDERICRLFESAAPGFAVLTHD